jgi:hypothetical protein
MYRSSFPDQSQERLFETHTCLGSVALEYSIYQKQFPHTKQGELHTLSLSRSVALPTTDSSSFSLPELKTWYELTTGAFKQAEKAAPDDFLRANARSNLAGTLLPLRASVPL